jgi:uncharacterized protein YcbK (DUF882 family)
MIRRALLPVALVIAGLAQAPLLLAQGTATPTAGSLDSFAPAIAPVRPAAVATQTAPSAPLPVAVEAAPAPPADPASDLRAVYGVSGALRAAVLRNGHPVELPLLETVGSGEERPQWVPVLGTVRRGLLGEPVGDEQVIAPDGAGMWRLDQGAKRAYAAAPAALTYITTVPFAEKRDGRLNGYHIGTYPTEYAPRDDIYSPPAGFIEVTPENQELQVSAHFRLRQFLTKDQVDVWPKYLALNLRLVDKLELVIQELNAMGVRALGVHVMSGFRTPQYNGPGGDGRATLSRHMYGDAADIWVDGDHDGYIDDLNGDGRNDIRDAEVLLRAVERVEQKYPELTGGAGLYEANGEHGPYVHVDVRGSRARW